MQSRELLEEVIDDFLGFFFCDSAASGHSLSAGSVWYTTLVLRLSRIRSVSPRLHGGQTISSPKHQGGGRFGDAVPYSLAG
jgi:hypothetical protein